MTTLVFNGWAAGPETWALTTFQRDRVFDYLEQLDGLPERLEANFPEYLLVGFSMGSVTALKLAIAHPQKVRGLVLISATPRMMEDKSTNWSGFSSRRLAAFKYGTELMFRDNPSPLYSTENLERGLEFLKTEDLRGELEQLSPIFAHLNFPVHIIHSERDGIVRPHNPQYLKTIFPQATITWISGNEHSLPLFAHKTIDQLVVNAQTNACQ